MLIHMKDTLVQVVVLVFSAEVVVVAILSI
jgi:hypothetical protein